MHVRNLPRGKSCVQLALILLTWGLASGLAAGQQNKAKPPHVVFLFSDHYSPDKTMPPVVDQWAKQYGFKATYLGMENDRTNMPGLEALKTADLMVVFMRWRSLPEEQFRHILDYLQAGGPVVGLRTATHATRYPKGHKLEPWGADGFGPKVFGQKWLRHGKYDRVVAAKGAEKHPILDGVDVSKLDAGDLYHLLPVPKSIEPVLIGRRADLDCPVAWTWKPFGGRVFYTSFGRQNDFKNPQFRRLLLNSFYWAMDRKLPER